MNRNIELSNEILRLVGPVPCAVVGAADDALLTQLWLAGADARAFDSTDALAASGFGAQAVIVCGGELAASMARARPLLERLHETRARFVVLAPMEARAMLASAGLFGSTQYWAGAAVQAGFRRSPAGFRVADYARANDPALPELLLLERIDAAVLAAWPMDGLLRDRDLHMDMTREIGPRADAHLVRYALAAGWVRAGDTVLDCACGLGYGTALLAAQSQGARFIGVDLDAGSVRYAADNFGHYGAEYRAADATALSFLPDASVDLIVSFETIEHVPDYALLMQEFARVLKPDGRVIGSVPHLWVDDTGRDPNPHHFHAFDWDKLAACFDDRFVIEKRYRQEAPSGFKLIHADRNLQEVPLGQAIDDTEWWIVVAAANPLRAGAANYRHPAFHAASAAGAHVADFGTWYDNPWIYRSLVQLGERITDPAAARQLTLELLAGSRNDSADFGAAATVLTYSVIASGERHDFADDLFALAEGYVGTASDNPHVRRWQISLGYAAGLLALSIGRRADALRWFDQVQAQDAVRAFSPLLATKTVAAGYWAAILCLSDGNAAQAEMYLRNAIDAGARALHADPREAIGDAGAPLAFGFPELAEVADMTSQCVHALRNLPVFGRAPGRFWATVDVRRFGLASWAQAVQRENEHLRNWIAALQRTLIETQLAMAPEARRAA